MKQKNKLVSIIIVNWNGLSLLKICLRSIFKISYKPFEIIVVDNASFDESSAWVKKTYPTVHVIDNAENVGFAKGNDIGFADARGEYIVFLNNDTKVVPDFLDKLVSQIEDDPHIGGAQSKILLMDDQSRLDSIGAYLTPTGFLYHFGFGKKDLKEFDNMVDLYTAKGACMIFKRKVLEEIAVDGNIFDPRYFAYFEETDLCHRVWLAGYRIVYGYPSVIYHKMGATSSSMNMGYIQYHSYKNRLNSYLKNLSIIYMLYIIPFHIILSLGIAWWSLLISKNYCLWKAIHKAIWWNIVNMKQTRIYRIYIQKYIRKKSDKDIMPSIMKHPSISYYASLLRG